MSALAELLRDFWAAMGIHLWQTLLVLVALGGLALGMRRAPASWTHRLWTVGLIKLFLPLALFGGLLERLLKVLGIGGAGVSGHRTLEVVGAVMVPARVAGGSVSVPLPDLLLIGVTLLWLAGTLVLMARLSRDMLRGHDHGRGPDRFSPKTRARIDAALRGSGIPRGRLRVADGFAMPSVAGIFRPHILVPERLVHALPVAELRAVLLHEDQHRLRRDPLRRLAHRVAMMLFFFFPPLHLVLRRLRETAEFACDEGALNRGIPGPVYRRALARTLTLGLAPALSGAAALGGEPPLLRRRFERLAQPWRYRFMPRHRLLVLTAVLLLVAGSFVPLGAVAEDPPAEPNVTKVPVPIHTVAPEYPDSCKRADVSGLVKVKIVVSPQGLVSRTEILEGVEECPALDEAAAAAAAQWRFEPGEIDGKPAAVEMVIPFKFALE